MLIGGTLGWLILLVFGAVQAACHLIVQQTGLFTAVVVDPQGATEERLLSTFYTLLTILVFLSLNLHLVLIRVVLESFVWIPPGSLRGEMIPAFLGHCALTCGADLLVAGMSLALPVVLGMLFVSLIQGLLGRTLPEAELLVLGLPVRLVAGLGLLAVTLPASSSFIRVLLENAVADGQEVLKLLMN
jgi:flagellar biosynthetic protein FliR